MDLPIFYDDLEWLLITSMEAIEQDSQEKIQKHVISYENPGDQVYHINGRKHVCSHC